MKKTLIVYHYFHNTLYESNLDFFIRKGLINDVKYDYVFLINGDKCDYNFPKHDNINVIYTRENFNDLYTYSKYLQSMNDSFYESYSYFYFINATCIGPFMPTICQNNWIHSMNEILVDYDMIGPIVEIPPDNLGFTSIGIRDQISNIPFLHSYMFGLNKNGFSIIKNTLLNFSSPSKSTAIMQTERALASSILLSGGKIKSLLSKYINIDINDPMEWNYFKHNGNKPSCYEIPNNYYGIDVHPFEIIFVKNIRSTNQLRDSSISGISNILTQQINNYVSWL